MKLKDARRLLDNASKRIEERLKTYTNPKVIIKEPRLIATLFKKYYHLVSLYDCLSNPRRVRTSLYVENYINNRIKREVKLIQKTILPLVDIYDLYIDHILNNGANDRSSSSDLLRYLVYGSGNYFPLDSEIDKSFPKDFEDFGRCYRFLTLGEFDETSILNMTHLYPGWTPVVENWKKLSDLYEKVLFEDLPVGGFNLFIKGINNEKKISQD
jgi:hypothetical protein